MNIFRTGPVLIPIGIVGGLFVNPVQVEDSPIFFDNRPESGIPHEARTQAQNRGEKTPAPKDFPAKFTGLTQGSIKSIRVRYYNRDTWANIHLE